MGGPPLRLRRIRLVLFPIHFKDPKLELLVNRVCGQCSGNLGRFQKPRAPHEQRGEPPLKLAFELAETVETFGLFLEEFAHAALYHDG